MIQPDLQELMNTRHDPSISIFMPVRHVRSRIRENPIRFKNLFSTAEDLLAKEKVKTSVREKILGPACELAEDPGFWRGHNQGLALYMSPSFFRYYRLPTEIRERVVVSDRFHLKPLLHCVVRNMDFFLLALSQNSVRLFSCNRYECEEIHVEGLPYGISDALRYDDPEKQIQYHTRTQNKRGDRDAVFHGQGMGKDEKRNRIVRYFRRIDRELHPILAGENTPLVVSAVDYLIPIYGEVNTFPHLIEGGVAGNPEELGIEEMRIRALHLFEPIFAQDMENTRDSYMEMRETDTTTRDVSETVSAACRGRVDSLFVALDKEIWGTVNAVTHEVSMHDTYHANDEDLLDRAAVETVLHSGRVFPVPGEEMPDESPVAAVFRY